MFIKTSKGEMPLEVCYRYDGVYLFCKVLIRRNMSQGLHALCNVNNKSSFSCPPQPYHNSCTNVSEGFPSSLSSSSTASSPHSPTPSSSSSDSQLDLCSPSAESGGARPKPNLTCHKRSVSMTSLPVYNRQVDDSCIIRISVDLGHNNGNMYKSILVRLLCRKCS